VEAYPARDLLAFAAALLGDAATACTDVDHIPPGTASTPREVWAQWCRGVAELRHGSPYDAAGLLTSLTRHQLTLGTARDAAWSMHALAWALAACQHNEHAAVLLGAAHRHRPCAVTMAGTGPVAELHEQWTTTTRARLGEQNFGAAFDHGTALEHAELLAYLRDLPDPAQHSEQQPGGLSKREFEIAGLIAAGLTKQIAAKLYVSIRTVDTHGESIRHKLGISGPGSRMQIGRWWGLQPQS
jgi:non-specific serine/threonine protein kinase